MYLGKIKSLFFICFVPLLLNATDLTFFVSSDMHYGYRMWGDNEELNKKAIDDMNRLPGTRYPPNVGGVVDKPVGVIVPGDLTGSGDFFNWHGYLIRDGFKHDYKHDGTGRINYPVYEGYGNHDVNDEGKRQTVLDGIKKRNKSRVHKVTVDKKSGLHYTFVWGGVRFFNLNIYPGADDYPPQSHYDDPSRDINPKDKVTYNSLQFLQNQLQKLKDPEQPIVIYFHYDFTSRDRWWDTNEKERFYRVIKDFNVIAIITGHTHRTQIYTWKGLNIFNVPAVKNNGTYFVFHITDGQITAVSRRPGKWIQDYKVSW